MIDIKIDFDNIKGKIKPMHAVGQPPMVGLTGDFMHYLTEAHIPYSRLHDVGGLFGGAMYVDIPIIFKNFDADVDDPDSYDFAFTDELLKYLDEADCKPIYRLGVTIENYAHIKAYHIYPPKDYEKWASICEHIIMHYNEGWNNGFHYGIEYWEIWNEPEDGPNNEMWLGSDVDYFRLYDITSKRLKNTFGNKIKVGGFACCNLEGILQDTERFGLTDLKPMEKNYRYYFLEYTEKFFKYINEHNSPIDFFSWHSYASNKDIFNISRGLENLLKMYGHEGLETQLNEWNNAFGTDKIGTSYASAAAAALMLAMQDSSTDILCYYDARIGSTWFAGMFDAGTYRPTCTYYSFKAFGELYDMGKQVECEYDGKDSVFVQAATDGNGRKGVMIANTGNDTGIRTNLPKRGMAGYLIDKDNHMTYIGKVDNMFTLFRDQVILLLNE